MALVWKKALTTAEDSDYKNSNVVVADISDFVSEVNSALASQVTTELVKAVDADGLRLEDDGGNGIFVKDGGNVGIGTTSPDYDLEVVGSFRADAFRTDETAHTVFVGDDAGGTGTFSVAIGEHAGQGNTVGYQTVLGYAAGYSNSGDSQTAMGHAAGQSNSGASQTAMGHAAGYSNSGDHQTTTGYLAGYKNTGASQTAMGHFAGYKNTGASQTAMGHFAGNQNSGNSQTVLGYYTGYKNTGNSQTAMGYAAGQSNSGNQTTAMGYEATKGNSGNDVVALGYQAGKDNTVANQFIVKQANINTVPLIQGDFSTGNVGIGVADPHSKLEVNGAISSAVLAVTSANDGTVAVGGINSIFIDASVAAVTINDFTGGVAGQVIYLVVKTPDASNAVTITDTSGSNQELYLHSEADYVFAVRERGGFVFICDGSNWYGVSHAKHV